MKAMFFDLRMLKSKPKRYRFFASHENVLFGDEAQAKRFDRDPDYADRTAQIRWVDLSGGDFGDQATARWIADALNKAARR